MARPYHKRDNPVVLDVLTGADRWCPECKQYKPREEFNNNASRTDGLSVYCRLCNQAKHRDYVKRNPHIIRGCCARWRKKHREHDLIRKQIQNLHRKGKPVTKEQYERLIQTHPSLKRRTNGS